MGKNILKLIKSIRSKKVRSIRYKLILNYSILICLLVFFIGAVSLIVTTKIIMNNISYYVMQTVKEANDKINTALKNIESLSMMIVSNQEIQDIVRENNVRFSNKSWLLLWESYKKRETIKKILSDISVDWTNIYSIGIYSDVSKGRHYFGSMGDVGVDIYNVKPVESNFEILDNNPWEIIWVPTYNLIYDIWLFSLERKIIDFNTFNPVGTLVINVKSQCLSNILDEKQLGKSGEFYLIDQEGNIISSKGKKEIGKKFQHPFVNKILSEKEGSFVTTLEGIPMLVAYCTSSYTKWKIVGIVPLNELNAQIIRNQVFLISIGIIGIIISLILSIVIASKITLPIKKMLLAMKKVERGQLEVNFKDNTFIETKELSKGFEEMLKNLKKLITKVYEGELRKKEAEFKALQAQINPHFLYNTLDTINLMLIIEKKYDLSKLVTYLGDILRYNINKGDNIVTLRQDIEQIEKYLYIQKVRFGDRLNYEIHISKETAECRILKLLIQPLVENAIKHGIEKKRGQGILKISSYLRGNTLVIQIEDNGIGISADRIEQIMEEQFVSDGINYHTRMGIANVNQRIKMFYGEKYGVKIQSEVGRGTVVKIFLPVIKGGRNN